MTGGEKHAYWRFTRQAIRCVWDHLDHIGYRAAARLADAIAGLPDGEAPFPPQAEA